VELHTTADLALPSSDLDVFVTTDHYRLAAFRSEELEEQRLELLHGHPSVDDNVDFHAGLAELEGGFRAVFCLFLVVTAQMSEVGRVGIDPFPVAVGADWVLHWSRN
jgi:hypothetical protein